jgi:hypothetical protein
MEFDLFPITSSYRFKQPTECRIQQKPSREDAEQPEQDDETERHAEQPEYDENHESILRKRCAQCTLRD